MWNVILTLLIGLTSRLSAETDIRLAIDFQRSSNEVLEAAMFKELHVIPLRICTALDYNSLKETYSISVLIESNLKLETEVITLKDTQRLMLMGKSNNGGSSPIPKIIPQRKTESEEREVS